MDPSKSCIKGHVDHDGHLNLSLERLQPLLDRQHLLPRCVLDDRMVAGELPKS